MKEQQYQKKISDNLQGIKIFKAFRNIKVRTEGPSTKGNLSPETIERVENTLKSGQDDNIKNIINLSKKTKNETIDFYLDKIVEDKTCFSLSEIR